MTTGLSMSYPDSTTEARSSAEGSSAPAHLRGLQDLKLVKNSDPRSAILSIDGENADQSGWLVLAQKLPAFDTDVRWPHSNRSRVQTPDGMRRPTPR